MGSGLHFNPFLYLTLIIIRPYFEDFCKSSHINIKGLSHFLTFGKFCSLTEQLVISYSLLIFYLVWLTSYDWFLSPFVPSSINVSLCVFCE